MSSEALFWKRFQVSAIKNLFIESLYILFYIKASLPWYRGKDAMIVASPTPYTGEDAMMRASPTPYIGEDGTMTASPAPYSGEDAMMTTSPTLYNGGDACYLSNDLYISTIPSSCLNCLICSRKP